MNEKTVVGTLVEHDGKTLFLKRSKHEKHGPLKWGIAAGGKKQSETPLQAALRELQEETGYEARAEELETLGTYHWQSAGMHIIFPAYRLRLTKPIMVILNPEEHDDYAWVTPQECAMRTDLVDGLAQLLKEVYGF